MLCRTELNQWSKKKQINRKQFKTSCSVDEAEMSQIGLLELQSMQVIKEHSRT